MARVPLGAWLLGKIFRGPKKDVWYKGFILVLTFFAYTSYHISRKPIGVVKGVLNRNCSEIPDGGSTPLFPVFNTTKNGSNYDCWCCWKPFNGGNAKELLGSLDYAYLFAYAVGMFASGHIAERMDLRYFLTGGMLLSGVFTAAVGMAYFYNIHSFAFFLIIQIIGGLFQATGWPSVVAVVANWFGKGRRGFIMGVWNSHTSVGNILGSVVAGAFVDTAWGWSFVVPGIIISVMAVIVFLFLVVYPADVNCTEPKEVQVAEKPIGEQPAISLWRALLIPGVIEFSMCLFFAKLVSYTFLFWLPYYLEQTMKPQITDGQAANLSTLFDFGGILGGILAGLMADLTGSSGIISFLTLIAAAPLVYIYNLLGGVSFAAQIGLMMATGFFVNGPYALITTAVSADLGTHPSLQGNAKALSTVTAIIDGTGTIGAAIGPLLTGMIDPTNTAGWREVFLMLTIAELIGALLIMRQAYKELRSICCKRTDTVNLSVQNPEEKASLLDNPETTS